MKIKLIRFEDNLIEPKRAHYDDAGIDCYAQEDFVIEKNNSKFFDNQEDFLLDKPKMGNIAIVPLGFGLEIPNGYMATIRPRSSWNIKGIICQIGTIDSGYRGEIKAAFINLTPNDIKVLRGEKICQIVIEPVVIADFVDNLGEERKTGGFGSTGK